MFNASCFVVCEQDLMEALLLLESCLDPKWLKPWYRPVQQKMQSTSHLLRLSTPAAVALRLFALDRAILYDKVCVLCVRGKVFTPASWALIGLFVLLGQGMFMGVLKGSCLSLRLCTIVAVGLSALGCVYV